MSHILPACHGGASSEGAAGVAKALSARTGLSLRVVAVLPPPAPMDYGYGPVFVPDARTEAVLEEKLLADVRRQLARCGIATVEPKLVIGTPAATIAEAAQESGASVIVLGLGPHHFTDRALGGETALQLAQIASTPVLAVPGSVTALPRHVAAMDFSITSLAAARLAISLLRAGDVLDLVHVGSDAPEQQPRQGGTRGRNSSRSLLRSTGHPVWRPRFACWVTIRHVPSWTTHKRRGPT